MHNWLGQELFPGQLVFAGQIYPYNGPRVGRIMDIEKQEILWFFEYSDYFGKPFVINKRGRFSLDNVVVINESILSNIQENLRLDNRSER